jgi:hypothetical protein
VLEQIKSKLGKYTLVQSPEALELVKPTGITCIDIETFGADKLPGDCAASAVHGISGIALANSAGDGMYIQVSDGPGRPGVPIQLVIEFLNNRWFRDAKIIIGHNFAKFDLGFLMQRGLKINPAVKLVDTWIIRSIQSEGVFTSNRLKDVVREQFKIETEGKNNVDNWLAANQTRDYGDIPIEIVGPYAVLDAQYCLMLLFTQKVTEEEWENHDRYVRNSLAVNKSEIRGICLDIPSISSLVPFAMQEAAKFRSEVIAALGATELDIDDDQVMLKFLHSKNFHSGPRDYFGENKFVFDRESLLEHYDYLLPRAYLNYQDHKVILDCLSTRGEMKHRVFKGEQSGFYASILLSIFSKGGILQCKAPDFLQRLTLSNSLRALFKPRPDKKFVSLQAQHLPVTLLGFYSQDTELQAAIRDNISPAQVMAQRTGFEPEACEILMRQIIEGSGNALLEKRLKAAKIRLKGKTHFAAKDLFAAQIMGFSNMKDRITKALESEGFLRDRLKRKLQVPQDKRWRSHSVLIGSSNGSMLSFYFDLFSRAADATGANFLIGHESELVWEVDQNSNDFADACKEIISRNLIEPKPVWKISSGLKWEKA